MKTLSQEVYQMRQCQRKADNLDFYLHKYRAEKLIAKYKDDYSSLESTCQRDYLLASSRYYIVFSDYLMQIGKQKEAVHVMDELASSNTLNLNADTLLWLNYLSHQAAVRFIPVDLKKNRKDIEKGYDCLMQCYILSSRNNITLYKAVSMQLLSQYLENKSIFQIVRNFDAASIRYINEDGVPDSLLAGNLAERSLYIFLKQKDAYLTAGAWRNLAQCYFDLGDAMSAVACLNNILANPALDSMPDIKAGVSEQMSMAYAALNDKHMSDVYRNQYLDLQDSTRQDREVEARVIALGHQTRTVWILVSAASILLIMLGLITILLIKARHRKQKKVMASEEELEELQDRLSMFRIQCSDAIRAQVELRAQISVVNGMLPLIERMRNAVERHEDKYAREIASDIDIQNALLTRWIKLQQGSIAPKIENVSINDVFDVVRQNNKRLNVVPSPAIVKADKTLTLFIINTLIENALRAIDDDGSITVSCIESNESHYAEISVSDTGKGMTAEQVDHLFEVKPITDEHLDSASHPTGVGQGPLPSGIIQGRSHGFGLQNCRGIINRYRKISSLFSVCDIMAKSRLGEGTTISFRLPLVIKTLIAALFISANVSATEKIEAYADSLYMNNVEGHYSVSMHYADLCNAIIKASGDEGVKTETILSVYNETAVAALALHQWTKYRYYNYLYTNLYKEYTSDKSLPLYMEKMHKSEMTANIIMLLILILAIALVAVLWFVYLKPMIAFRRDIRHQKNSLEEDLRLWKSRTDRLHVINNVVSNQLSTVKHETMYYPSRISQMMDSDEKHDEVVDVVAYYSKLYSLLSTKMIAQQLSDSWFMVHGLRFCDVDILANEELLDYLMLLLKRHNGGRKPEHAITSETDKYVTVSFLMDKADFTENDIELLFTVNSIHTDYLVMRQIMRETGDASLCYGTGINATSDNGQKNINVTFPKSFSKIAQ